MGFEIPLTKGYSTLVDEADLAELRRHSWYAHSNGQMIYAARSTRRKGKPQVILMHRQIMLPDSHLVIDHIDRNSLNNRRSNLRICTRRDNQGNRKVRKDATFEMKGVHASHRQFQARIGIGDKELNLGCFDTPEKAHAAYCEAARKYFGEFARSA